MWLGYPKDYPYCWTHGESEAELRESLVDIYKDLNGGAIPNVRHVAELEVA